ncbi:MAG TPA: asparagine synthase (glutamine-hydrolyzing) [Candidatus Binatia bacterium]|jgi:asparagine synthase (glutamine-hydrolysing)
MCGIYGYLSRREPVDAGVLRRMGNTLAPRGPDDEGEHIERQSAASIGLGHKRLSIFDLSAAARQPMSNEDGSVRITCNGEIYNFRELRSELSDKGHAFRSNSDTEVIVHLYEEMGVGCLDRLKGMFAFALWDQKKSALFLARDRMGKKPLHYASYEGGIAFASEIKALLQHPAVGRSLDLSSLNKYLALEYVPAPHSIYKSILKLEPGHYLWHENGASTVKKYWDLPLMDYPIGYKTEEEYAEELRAILDRAVRARLAADVPVGVFLSGGIDSGLVAAFAARAQKRIECFSIGFEEKSFDESRHADSIAKALDLNLSQTVFTTQEMLAQLDRLPDFLDEPMADASILPSYMLAKTASQDVKVALSGDGGDELFAGYPTYQAHRLITYYDLLPEIVKQMIRFAAAGLPVSHHDISPDFKIKQFLRGAGVSSEIRFFIWMGSFTEAERKALLTDDFKAALARDNTYEDIFAYVRESGLNKDLERILYLSTKLYLQDDILVKVDRASMANGLEVRCPLLDQELVEFACRLPLHYKLRGLTTKYLLKKAAAGILPDGIITRKKKGFGIPISQWLGGELKNFMLDHLSERRIKQQGYFNYACIRGLIDDHLKKKKDNRKLLWTLLIFQVWHEKYIDGAR